MDSSIAKASDIITWIIIVVLVAFVLVKGIFALTMVKNPGPPSWDYRPVKDIPGESPYAIYEKLPYPQHIRGEKGE